MNKTLSYANLIFVTALWVGGLVYLYGVYELGFFSGFHPSKNWPFLDLALKVLMGLLMVLGPLLLLTLCVWRSPKSIVIKFVATFTVALAAAVSINGDAQGVLFFLDMILSWLISIVTLAFVLGDQPNE